jgi:hypothetical protein
MAKWIRDKVAEKRLGDIRFWRSPDSGVVSVSPIEKGAPAWSEGKYMTSINAPSLESPISLDTRIFKIKMQAIKYAEKLKRQYKPVQWKKLRSVM